MDDVSTPPGKLPLVGLTGIAQGAGVQKPVVAVWRTGYEDFPDSVADLRTGSVWLWPLVEAWLLKTGRITDAGWTLEQVTAGNARQRLDGAIGRVLSRDKDLLARLGDAGGDW